MGMVEMAATIQEIVWHEVLNDADFDDLFDLYSGTFRVMAKHPKLIRFDNAIVEIMDLLNDSNNNPLTEKDMVVLIYITAVMKGIISGGNVQLAATALGINGSFVTSLVLKVGNILTSGNAKHQQGRAKANQYNHVAPMRLHYYYRKGIMKRYIFTGSSGSPNITVCCPMPRKQDLYSGSGLKSVYDTMISNFISIMADIPVAFNQAPTKAGVLRVPVSSLNPPSPPLPPNTLKVGYIHYDTQNSQNGIPIISKQDENKIYAAMVKNPELLNVLFNRLIIANNVCQIIPSSGFPSPNAREIPTTLVFSMANSWETFQITSVIEQTTCPPQFTYQICHKAGFTINGNIASLTVLDGSGWCGM